MIVLCADQDEVEHAMPKRKRAFARDGFIGFRVPEEDKQRLFEVGRKKRRDPSSLLLEWMTENVARAERELAVKQAGQS
jgi:hypothetical protein